MVREEPGYLKDLIGGISEILISIVKEYFLKLEKIEQDVTST